MMMDGPAERIDTDSDEDDAAPLSSLVPPKPSNREMLKLRAEQNRSNTIAQDARREVKLVPPNPYAKRKVGYGGSSKSPQTYFGKSSSRPSNPMFRSQHDRLNSRLLDPSKPGGLRNIGNR